jgi:hypothetical protein
MKTQIIIKMVTPTLTNVSRRERRFPLPLLAAPVAGGTSFLGLVARDRIDLLWCIVGVVLSWISGGSAFHPACISAAV